VNSGNFKIEQEVELIEKISVKSFNLLNTILNYGDGEENLAEGEDNADTVETDGESDGELLL